MGTRSVVGVPQGDGWRGRYIHWDGYPGGVGVELLKIVTRDGLEKAVKTLTEDFYGWSSLDSEITYDVDKSHLGDRSISVSGYGSAYSPEDQKDEWITHDGDNWGAEYAYVLSPKGMAVLEATRQGDHAIGMFGFNSGDAWSFVAFIDINNGVATWGEDSSPSGQAEVRQMIEEVFETEV